MLDNLPRDIWSILLDHVEENDYYSLKRTNLNIYQNVSYWRKIIYNKFIYDNILKCCKFNPVSQEGYTYIIIGSAGSGKTFLANHINTVLGNKFGYLSNSNMYNKANKYGNIIVDNAHESFDFNKKPEKTIIIQQYLTFSPSLLVNWVDYIFIPANRFHMQLGTIRHSSTVFKPYLNKMVIVDGINNKYKYVYYVLDMKKNKLYWYKAN